MTMPEPTPMPVNLILIRRVAGWAAQYFASGLLVPVLLLCLGALVFCQVSLLGANLDWLGNLVGLSPMAIRDLLGGGSSAGVENVDFAALASRVFWLGSLGVMALEFLWRLLRDALFAKPSVINPRHVFRRRALVALVPISAIFATAFFAVTHARMADGADRNDLYVVFAVMYAVALGLALAWANTSSVAARLLAGEQPIS